MVFKGIYTVQTDNGESSKRGKTQKTQKIPVAIKILKKLGQSEFQEFINETDTWAICDHPYLVKLLGISLSSTEPKLVAEFLEFGDLLDNLKSFKNDENPKIIFNNKNMLNWLWQIANGMSYLAKKKIVHRDLAARNILMQTSNCVKITDFGLSKITKTEEEDEVTSPGEIEQNGDESKTLLNESNVGSYKSKTTEKMPIKWLAPEVWNSRIYNEKTDVWSFGVTIWEILTLGEIPYKNYKANTLRNLPYDFKRGKILEQPFLAVLCMLCSRASQAHSKANWFALLCSAPTIVRA